MKLVKKKDYWYMISKRDNKAIIKVFFEDKKDANNTIIKKFSFGNYNNKKKYKWMMPDNRKKN